MTQLAFYIIFLFFSFSLLKAAASALQPGSIEFIETVHDIRQDHLNTAKQHISDTDILKRVHEELNQDCDRLLAFLKAVQVKKSLLDGLLVASKNYCQKSLGPVCSFLS